MGIATVFKGNTTLIPPRITTPNPNPNNFTILKTIEFKSSYILKIKYHGCTNFEGIKILVFKGKYMHKIIIDSHFKDDSDSPIARFRPDNEGWDLAIKFAKLII